MITIIMIVVKMRKNSLIIRPAKSQSQGTKINTPRTCTIFYYTIFSGSAIKLGLVSLQTAAAAAVEVASPTTTLVKYYYYLRLEGEADTPPAPPPDRGWTCASGELDALRSGAAALPVGVPPPRLRGGRVTAPPTEGAPPLPLPMLALLLPMRSPVSTSSHSARRSSVANLSLPVPGARCFKLCESALGATSARDVVPPPPSVLLLLLPPPPPALPPVPKPPPPPPSNAPCVVNSSAAELRAREMGALEPPPPPRSTP